MKYQPSYTKLLVRTSYKQHNPKHLKLIKLYFFKNEINTINTTFYTIFKSYVQEM